jgi:hypothetical protein
MYIYQLKFTSVHGASFHSGDRQKLYNIHMFIYKIRHMLFKYIAFKKQIVFVLQLICCPEKLSQIARGKSPIAWTSADINTVLSLDNLLSQ